MTLRQLKAFLDKNGLPGLPRAEDVLYTRYFVETEGFDYDWTICADVYDLHSFFLQLEIEGFDELDSMHKARVKSVGLDNNQFEWIQGELEKRQDRWKKTTT